MKEIAISKFKATCLSVVDEVRRTGKPVRITKFGKPVAELTPCRPAKNKSWLGRMRGTAEITGDIVGPLDTYDNWNPYFPE